MPRPAFAGRVGSLPTGRQEGAHYKRKLPSREATPFRAWSFTTSIFIRLRRRPRALPVDECVSGICANSESRYHCFGGFRHWRITLRSLGACAPKRFGAQGRRRVFLWRYHGLGPWGSISFLLKNLCVWYYDERETWTPRTQCVWVWVWD